MSLMVAQGFPKCKSWLPRLLRPITGMVSLPFHAENWSQVRPNMGREPGMSHWGSSLKNTYGTIIILTFTERSRGSKR